ncbi:MAG TPA: GNAT family N-acetyltransferase [Burkholderiales bacterium]|nr:GNAT family N-acetyltransferase [Burkholderiales bacterium]
MSWRIRAASADDAGAINDIQNYYVVNSTATFMTEPVALEQRLRWLENRAEVYPVTVVESGDQVVGWSALDVFRARPAYRHTTEFSVYVHHGWHRRGVGRALVLDLVERARSAGHHAMVGGCCSESTGVIALLQALGFSKVAHFSEVGHKFGRWLDVVFLQRLL